MKTVCFSANTSWYLFNFHGNTIKTLVARGYDVHCVAPKDDYSEQLECKLGAHFVPLLMDNAGNNPAKDVLTLLRLWGIYRRLSPMVVFQFTIKNNIYGTLAARLLNVPAVNNVSGLGTAFIHRGWVGKIVRLLYKISQPFATQVFCQNTEDQALLIQHKLVDQQKLALLPGSGVDLERFKPMGSRPHNQPFQFLFVGRMLGDKGLYELVQAYAALKESGQQIHLKLLGFADAHNKTAISQQQLSQWQQLYGVEWLGVCDEVEQVLAQSDCVVLPSYREGLPRSLLEACAMALPVIATDVPGCRSVVQDGFNGLLCQVQSVSSLRNAMQTMINLSTAERQQMGENGRAFVEEKFSHSLVYAAYQQVLDSIERSQGLCDQNMDEKVV